MAKQGFNVIATANDRDRGVNEMSAALKRRFNFLYIPVIDDAKIERQIVETRVKDLMKGMNFKIQIPDNIYSLITTSFQELRNGRTKKGQMFKKISSVMSTSEEISLLFDSCIYANYFGKQQISAREIALHLSETIIKDDKQNILRLQEYLGMVVAPRARQDPNWKLFYDELKIQLYHRSPGKK